jgi:hypothetical protein
MIPWETLDTAAIPGGAETLRLKRRGTEFSIMLGTNELMNSRLSGSEEALARLTIERLAAPGPAHPHRRPRPRLHAARRPAPPAARKHGSRWSNWSRRSSPGRAGRSPPCMATASTIRA